ncbi:DUF998 domain-containing protein [Streptacidiphilus sp. ASG 303]|uniref:DUF998 domain-containing protein n=1 Tax=Streptacidiphilus sp. ASG 303 TaxID=2896847 RepID=UPI001E3896FB|nr:DUF998 domain-containing protein [Streptacidiphilus sp. ASG 303]MCD0483558.1 DUF998 domain-containing protein [Streptacidiphilus sp. ASG 303]
MTQVVGTPLTSRSVPTPLSTRALLAGGALAGPLFLGVGVVEGLTRDGFDFTRNAISQLSLGPWGWIQVAGFLVTGVLVTAGAVGVRRAIGRTPGGTWAPRLIGVFGASFLLAGVFTADPGGGFPPGTPDGPATMSTHGAVHMFGGMAGYLALCAALLVLARHFAARGRRGWALACRLVPVGVLAGFAGSGATVAAFTAGAGLGLLTLTAVVVRLADRAPASPR